MKEAGLISQDQLELYERLKEQIPQELWDKYSHLGLNDMAKVDALRPWAKLLESAGTHWLDQDVWI